MLCKARKARVLRRYFDFDGDLLAGRDGRECLELNAPASDKYTTTLEGDELREVVPGKKWCATQHGTRHDNPDRPEDAELVTTEENTTLTAEQRQKRETVRARALSFEFVDTAVMDVTYTVFCHINTGRNFLFAGAVTALPTCPPAPT